MKRTHRFTLLHFMPRCKFSICLVLTTLAALGAAITGTSAKEPSHMTVQKPSTVFQFSTLPALSLGLYDGELTFRELLKHGDFGIGTFHALDGEMVILNGKAWRVRADGRVSPVENKSTTPFAIITRFAPDQMLKVTQSMQYSALQQRIALMFPTINAAYAIEISGTFARLKVRSVPGQSKPYRPLGEVVKSQSVWEWNNVRGTLVGFRFPSYLAGVNLADYHFHFLADDKQRGGHLLDRELQDGTIRVQTLRGFMMQLPSDYNFDRADLTADQSAALQAAEKAGPH